MTRSTPILALMMLALAGCPLLGKPKDDEGSDDGARQPPPPEDGGTETGETGKPSV
jgi:hypothetical protein